MYQPGLTPFPFLNLSRELRDIIYEILLLSQRAPPSSPEYRGARKQPSSADAELLESCNRYPAEDLINPTVSLQLTCRQVSEEIHDATLRLEKSKGLTHKLDVMMLNEDTMYPTWLSFPGLTDRIVKLDVEFRLFCDREIDPFTSEWKGGDGGPSLMIWSLFTLMRRFLLRGPCFLSPVKRNRKIMVEELSINIQTPSVPPPNGFFGEHSWQAWMDRENHLHPKRIVGMMTSEMSHLLRRTRYTVRYATLIFERIKRITFSLDGEEQQSWDLTTLKPEYNTPNDA
ncbi:MAG: hypothetical protein Q9170_004867 [Blastenia crenularia]